MWETLPNNADRDCLKTPTLQEILMIQNSHTFVPISSMCKKQTAVSYSSTEPEIISLDAGLRLDGVPTLELWDLIVSVFGSMTQTSDRTGRPVDTERSQTSQGKINVMENIDSVPSNVQSSRQEALLYVFEDNEAVIKRIIKGRSSTMGHVSRTHRVATDWFFDKINLHPEIQKPKIEELSNILTKGNFTLHDWNQISFLFHINHFNSTNGSDAMPKRKQKDSGEERVTANSKQMMSFVSRCTETPDVHAPNASESPGKTLSSSTEHPRTKRHVYVRLLIKSLRMG